MWLVYCILILFSLLFLLALLEDRIEPKLKLAIYYCVGIILVVMAGCREIGFDPDSVGYERYFKEHDSTRMLDTVEYSYILLCQFFSEITDDVHAIFFVYAILGVMLKLQALRKFSDSLFLMLLVYVSYYFELHETTQIRTGVLSGIFLFVLYYVAESKRWIAGLLILVGSFFHLSGLTLILVLFLNNNPINKRWMWFLWLIIPASYAMPLVFNSILAYGENIPYIGSKIARYQAVEETGIIQVSGVNIFSPFHMFSVMVYYMILYFKDKIMEKDKYFSLFIKVFAISLSFYAAFSFLPVLAERLSYLYKIVTIILFADICYIFKPRWCGIVVTLLVAFVYLNYILRSMYEFSIFLQAN